MQPLITLIYRAVMVAQFISALRIDTLHITDATQA